MGRQEPLTGPAFYALAGRGAWQEYVTLLHVPYTLWHLSYVAIGAAVAPAFHPERLAGALLAFFLAVGIGAHVLDELNGRPLRTQVPRAVLVGLGLTSVGGAVGLGLFAATTVTPTLLPFIAFGAFIVVAYNLELAGGRFHSDWWFAASWGAFPAVAAYWVNSPEPGPALPAAAAFGFVTALAQRRLSAQARFLRRTVESISGSVLLADGTRRPLHRSWLIDLPERVLKLLSTAMVLLAVMLVTARFFRAV